MALQAAAYAEVEPYPLDVLGAQSEGMIGYVLEQELGNELPQEVPLATVLTMVEVDPGDPAFRDPTKFVGPVYTREQAARLARRERLGIPRGRDAPGGECVPSPQPRRIFEIRPIRWLLDQGVIVICAGRRRRSDDVHPGKPSHDWPASRPSSTRISRASYSPARSKPTYW